jgi:hypothetical protein
VSRLSKLASTEPQVLQEALKSVQLTNITLKKTTHSFMALAKSCYLQYQLTTDLPLLQDDDAKVIMDLLTKDASLRQLFITKENVDQAIRQYMNEDPKDYLQAAGLTMPELRKKYNKVQSNKIKSRLQKIAAEVVDFDQKKKKKEDKIDKQQKQRKEDDVEEKVEDMYNTYHDIDENGEIISNEEAYQNLNEQWGWNDGSKENITEDDKKLIVKNYEEENMLDRMYQFFIVGNDNDNFNETKIINKKTFEINIF